MYGKAFAPEYQGVLSEMSVNTDYRSVLETAKERERDARRTLAQSRLAMAEACRRLGRLDEAESAWRGSYRAARDVPDEAAMAWALWSGGTLARQRGRLNLAVRWLSAARDLADRGGDRVAFGYSLAGVAETLRIRGDHQEARVLHVQLLDEAREQGACRHIVWALEGLAQLDRNAGDLDAAWSGFDEAARIAEDGGDERGLAWALRGQADVLSLRGEHDEALALLARGEQICRRMDLASALAYNRKMRGNVLFRASWYGEAARTYRDAWEKFQAIEEPRGSALARLGLLKSLDRLGRPRRDTERELRELRDRLDGHELRHTKRMVEEALEALASPVS
ncbi:tetratricopeptide repeat protein [Saccharopolyspora rosea]|uniref:Tetratricopeptide repeat protein n=1 Tax=Saccharopolyspora rosea TaxID=524884 RepID=A0ABW3FLC5_9PSEU|nr:tetratricopeptide repeat protein [Saccharopolyspora rosea]